MGILRSVREYRIGPLVRKRWILWFVLELLRCFLLAWWWRRLRVATVSAYADASMRASELVAEMRARYPGRRLFWSFSTNHVTDSSQEYVVVWEVCGGDVATRMVFHGPIELMCGKVAEGFFDGYFNHTPPNL